MGDLTVSIDEFMTDPRIDEFVQNKVGESLGLDKEQKVVTIDAPYAQYVEFGSDSASGESNTNKLKDPALKDDDDEITEVNLRIREWAQDKYNLTDEERKTIGDKIYHDIMENGMKPRPFIRPAMFYLIMDMNTNPDKYIHYDGESIHEFIANELAGLMARTLAQHDTVISGDLMRGIRVVPISEVEGKEPPKDLKDIRPEIWMDPNLDRHGNWVPPRG